MVFISHSSEDADLAKELTKLLEGSFAFPPGSIRCTSVKGYELPGGTPTVAVLRQEIVLSVVVGLMTPNSIRAAWPLCEVGAAWGLGKNLIPLLAGGVSYRDIPEVIQGSNALDAANESDVQNLLNTLEKDIDGLCAQPRGKASEALKEFLEYVRLIPQHNFAPPEQWMGRDKMINDPKYRLQWSDIRKDCKSELLVWGWSCRNVINAKSRDAFSALAHDGVKIKLLILDLAAVERATALNFGPVCNTTSDDTIKDIREGVRFLDDFRTNHPGLAGARQNVELRKTKWVMTWSGVAIDPENTTGRLQIEFFHYNDPYGAGVHLDTRLNLLLTQSSPFYTGFWKSIDAMWEEAVPF